MESPYLVKRFVSADKVPGTSTFYYWLYSPKDNKDRAGLGEFFEVVSAEVDEKTCEYISKRIWDVFVDKYFASDFETALQKASFTLISVLRELQIDQIDINFAFWAIAGREGGKYSLSLAIVGQADVILVRNSKPIFLHEYAPANEDLRNLKYADIDLERKDKILVSNRFLLENLLKTDVLDLSTDHTLLDTLREAEKNFPGGQGIFLLGIEIQEGLNFRQVKTESQEEVRLEHVNGKTLAEMLDAAKTKVFQFARPIFATVRSKLVRVFTRNKKVKQERKLVADSAGSRRENIRKLGAITSDLSKYMDTETPKDDMQGNTFEDSQQGEHVDAKDERVDLGGKQYRDLASPSTLRLRRVWWGRIYLKFSRFIAYILRKRGRRSLYVDGQLGYRRASVKAKVAYLVGAVFISILVFNLVKSYHNKKEEKRQVTVFIQKEILPVIKMYEEQVKSIELTDPDNILDLCIKTAGDTLGKVETFKEKLSYIENKERISAYVSQLQKVKSQCAAKYDKVHHIVRVKNAKVVKDFAADLGLEVDIVSIVEQKGYLYAVDRGKKAVYRVNPETGRAIKLDDPDGFLRDPVDIGVNKDNILVCDRISGILEFRDGKFNVVVGTSPEALGSKCLLVRGFYTNAYFVLEDKSKLYKSTGVDTGYALPVVYIKNIKEVLDVAIDGNIYILRKVGETVKLERYFQGVLDNSFRFKEDLAGYSKLYTNPSGNFPIYAFNAESNTVLVIEKPTAKKHPGYGIVLKRIVLDNKELFAKIDDFAVNLGVDSNKEEYLFFVSKNVLWRVGLQGK